MLCVFGILDKSLQGESLSYDIQPSSTMTFSPFPPDLAGGTQEATPILHWEDNKIIFWTRTNVTACWRRYQKKHAIELVAFWYLILSHNRRGLTDQSQQIEAESVFGI